MKTLDQIFAFTDCETTGLRFGTDKVLELAVIFTDAQLTDLYGPLTYTFSVPGWEDLAGNFVRDMHHKSGLAKRLNDEDPKDLWSYPKADTQLCRILRALPKAKRIHLAGSSIEFDKRMLEADFPQFSHELHHRNLNVSSLILAFGHQGLPVGGIKKHRALDDVRESIDILKHYRNLLPYLMDPPL